LSEALDRKLGTGAATAKRAEHALADVAALQALIASAGFHDVVVHSVVKNITYPSAADFVRVQLSATPLASVMTGYGKEQRDRLVDALVKDVSAALHPFTVNGSLVFPQEAHVALARGNGWLRSRYQP
jgi:hypothetical protein